MSVESYFQQRAERFDALYAEPAWRRWLNRRLRYRGCCDASGRGRWHFGDDCRGRWGRKCLGLGRRRDCGNRGRAMQRSFLRQDDAKDRQKYRDRKRAGCHGHSHHSLQIWDAIPKHCKGAAIRQITPDQVKRSLINVKNAVNGVRTSSAAPPETAAPWPRKPRAPRRGRAHWRPCCQVRLTRR